MQLTQNFTLEEFLINQSEKPSSNVIENISRLANVLQGYRNTIFKNNRVKITSGWRSEKYNAKIGGTKNSWHIKGLAVDFRVENFTKKQLYDLMDLHHFGGVEWYLQNWNLVHIDLRGYVTRFDSQNRHLKSNYKQ